MKSLTLFAVSIFAVALIGCGDSSTNPKMAAPDYIHIKTGTTYQYLAQALDSNLMPVNSSQPGQFSMISDSLNYGGRTLVGKMKETPGGVFYLHFEGDGDTEILGGNDTLTNRWIRYPFYSKETFSLPSVDSLDQFGTRRKESRMIVFEKADTVIIGDTTFSALRVIDASSKDDSTSFGWSYSSDVSTYWFVPKIGFLGKIRRVLTRRGSNKEIIDRRGFDVRVISYVIK